MPLTSPIWRFVGASVALTGLAAGCSSNGHRVARPTTSVPSTSVPPPTSTTQPAPAYAASPFIWQRESSAVLDVGGGATTSLSALLGPELSEPWTLVGTRLSPTGSPAATLWTSADGDSWTAAALSPSGPSQASAASQYHGQVVVVGSVGQGANEQAAVWTSSAPGTPFTAAAVPVSDGPSAMNLVTQGSLGLFATGTVDGRFAMWSSTTGKRWGELPTAEKTITSVPGAKVNALMAEGDVVYAAGSVPAPSGTQAAVWSSSDGLQWHSITTASTAFAGPGARVIYSLAPLGTGLVAVGAINRGNGWQPASWISPDGASWSPASTNFPGLTAPTASSPGPGSAGLAVSAITTFSGSTSVVASAGGPGGERVWKSSDGLHWTAIPLPPTAEASTTWRPTLIAASTTTTVVADGDPGQPHVLTDGPAGWTEPSANPAVFGPVQPYASPRRVSASGTGLTLAVDLTTPPQAIGPAAVAVSVLNSPDGIHWEAAPATARSAQEPATLPAADAVTLHLPVTGWIAVGPSGNGYPNGWSSAGGAAWTPTGPLDPVSPTTATRPLAAVSGLCPAGLTSTGGVAAVGSATNLANPASLAYGRSAAAWWSSTGESWHRATITPAVPPESDESMLGCVDTGAGLVAYGTSSGPGGVPAPALWRSTSGSAWTRQTVAAFSADTPKPITDVAAGGSYWLAVADPNRAGPATEPAGGGAPVVGSVATTENGLNGLWLSTDSGQSWQRVDLISAPWAGALQTEVTLGAFAGSLPVVVGTVDGRLAVWVGSPVPGGTATTASG